MDPSIAQRFRRAREQAGLSLGQAARRINKEHSDIASIERAERNASVNDFAMFADLYGVSIRWLAGREQVQPELDEQMRLAARAGGKVDEHELVELISFLQSVRS